MKDFVELSYHRKALLRRFPLFKSNIKLTLSMHIYMFSKTSELC